MGDPEARRRVHEFLKAHHPEFLAQMTKLHQTFGARLVTIEADGLGLVNMQARKTGKQPQD